MRWLVGFIVLVITNSGYAQVAAKIARKEKQCEAATQLANARACHFVAKAYYVKHAPTAGTSVKRVTANAKKALRYYKRLVLIPQFAQYNQRADAIAEYAGLLDAQQQPKYSIAMWSLLVRDYPRHTMVPHGKLAMAEHYFSLGKLLVALKLYQDIASRPTSLRDYATYKLAWCHLNLNRHKEALRLFTQAAQSKGSGPKANLAQAAAKDAVFAYEAVGMAKHARQYFSRLPGSVESHLQRLAERYDSSGKLADAQTIWIDLRRKMKASPKDCLLGLAQVRTELGLGGNKQPLATLVALLQRYPSGKGKKYAACERELEALAKQALYRWQQTARATRSPQMLQLTQQLEGSMRQSGYAP